MWARILWGPEEECVVLVVQWRMLCWDRYVHTHCPRKQQERDGVVIYSYG